MHPVLFTIGPIQVRYYGLMYVLFILVGIFLIKKEVKRKNISLTEDDVINMVMFLVLTGILGARIYYVVFNWDYYGSHLLEIPAVWHGGLAIHGGLIGGVIAGLYFCKKRSLSFLELADAIAPAIILGQVFGRFGNFMNGDAHGIPTKMPWGIVFPPESIAGSQFGPVPLHPTMLYEMFLNFLIFLVLWGIRKRDYQHGFLFCLYLILYSIDRFFVSFFRADSLMIGGFRAAHVISIVIVILSGVFMFRKKLWRSNKIS
jgi:phosphatidylglycerol:prolipoprotein diacylglycerol transferase